MTWLLALGLTVVLADLAPGTLGDAFPTLGRSFAFAGLAIVLAALVPLVVYPALAAAWRRPACGVRTGAFGVAFGVAGEVVLLAAFAAPWFALAGWAAPVDRAEAFGALAYLGVWLIAGGVWAWADALHGSGRLTTVALAALTFFGVGAPILHFALLQYASGPGLLSLSCLSPAWWLTRAFQQTGGVPAMSDVGAAFAVPAGLAIAGLVWGVLPRRRLGASGEGAS